MKRLAAALLLALLAGCTTRAPERPPPLTTRPDVEPNFLVPSATERMVFLARQEWQLFGRPLVVRGGDGATSLVFEGDAKHEVQPAMLSRVLMYWYRVSDAPIVGTQGELRPWSAAFISWLARGAGLARDAFPDTVLHWDYIEQSLAAEGAAAFAARDPASHAPRVGDLVCNARGFVARFDSLRRGPYHCDLVVAVEPNAIETVGGNVGDAVALSRLETGDRGVLLPLAGRPWSVVLTPRWRN